MVSVAGGRDAVATDARARPARGRRAAGGMGDEMRHDNGRGFWAKVFGAAAGLALARGAPAQEAGAKAAQATSDSFERACVDLVHGKTPRSGQALDALRSACDALMKDKIAARRAADQRRQAREQLRVQRSAEASQSSAQVEPGESVLAAFARAGNELVGGTEHGQLGLRRTGQPFVNSVTTNPIGWFNNVGVNAELLRSFAPQLSWIGGAHYTQSAAASRTLYTLGFLGGVDWFVIGQHNEGLRVGPRLDLSFGRESSTSTATSGRLGLTGEVGYDFIAKNGITGQAAFGVGGRVAGDKNEQLSSSVGGEFGPYVKLGVGYSW